MIPSVKGALDVRFITISKSFPLVSQHVSHTNIAMFSSFNF